MASIRVDLQGFLVWYSEDDGKWEIFVESDSRITEDNVRQFKYENGVLVDQKSIYKYIILPCEMIESLLPLVDEVEDVQPPQFDILLDSVGVTTRAGNEVAIQEKTVRFFICKLLQWDDGDKEQVTGLIDYWNENNPTRLIDFECCFEDDYELEEFVNENSITEW